MSLPVPRYVPPDLRIRCRECGDTGWKRVQVVRESPGFGRLELTEAARCRCRARQDSVRNRSERVSPGPALR